LFWGQVGIRCQRYYQLPETRQGGGILLLPPQLVGLYQNAQKIVPRYYATVKKSSRQQIKFELSKQGNSQQDEQIVIRLRLAGIARRRVLLCPHESG
jgi:hypothetical protein